MPKALITGGAGFIGSHLAELLLDDGWEVFALDDLSTGSIQNVAHLREQPEFHLVVDSVLAPAVVGELVYKCDVVYHLAAAVGVRLIVEQPVHTLVTNVQGTETVLDYCNRFGKRVLIASSSEVYGDHREERPLQRGRPARVRPHDRAPLAVRGLEGPGRVPRARLPPGACTRLRDRTPVQHRRAEAERPVRDGDPELRPQRAGRRAARGARRRHADALVLPRPGHDPRAQGLDGRPLDLGRDLQRRARPSGSASSTSRSASSSSRARTRRSRSSRTTASTASASRTRSTGSRPSSGSRAQSAGSPAWISSGFSPT